MAAFTEEIHAWLKATNEPVEKEWLKAVDEVRAGHVKADLEKKPADSPRWAEVNVLKRAPQPLKFDPPMEVAA